MTIAFNLFDLCAFSILILNQSEWICNLKIKASSKYSRNTTKSEEWDIRSDSLGYQVLNITI